MGSVLGWLGLALLVVALANRERISAWFDRAERRQAAREARIRALRQTPNGHMALTIDHVDQNTPPVEALWVPGADGAAPKARFVWNGMGFDTREEADAVRQAAVLTQARAYYVDLDQQNALAARVASPVTDPTR